MKKGGRPTSLEELVNLGRSFLKLEKNKHGLTFIESNRLLIVRSPSLRWGTYEYSVIFQIRVYICAGS